MKKFLLIFVILLIAVNLFSFEYKSDKVTHSFISAGINTASYIGLKYYTEQKPLTIALESFAITAAIGVTKELTDSYFSTDDLIADGIGWAVSASCLALLEPFHVVYVDDYVLIKYEF